MKTHRQWEVLLAYFREIPIDKELIKKIEVLLAVKKNVLVMIAKEDEAEEPRFTQEEKFRALREIFSEETKSCKLIISAVPDIKNITKMDI